MEDKLDCIPLSELVQQSYELLYGTSLDCLTKLQVEPLPYSKPLPISLIRITTTNPLTSLDNLTPLLNGLQSLDAVLAYIIQSIQDKNPIIYIGIKSNHINTAITLLTTGLTTAYPSICFEVISEVESSHLLKDELFNPCQYTSLSLANFVPLTLTTSNTTLLSQNFLLLMGQVSYTVLLLSTSVWRQCIYDIILLLQNLSTRLSCFAIINRTSNVRNAMNDSRTDTEGTTTSTTHTTSASSSFNTSNSYSSSNANTYTATPKITDSLSTTLTTSCNTSATRSDSKSNSTTPTDSDSRGCNNSVSILAGKIAEKGSNCSYRKDDKTASTLITQITVALSRLYGLLYLNVYDFAAYFLAPEAANNIRATYTYMHLFANTTLNLQPNTVNTWYQGDPDFNTLFFYLSTLSHPLFIKDNCKPFLATQLISTIELQSLFYIPATST